MACLPSRDLDDYSRGAEDVTLPPTGGEAPPPAPSTPGAEPGPGGVDQTDPTVIAPSDPPSEGETNNASNGVTSGDAGAPVPAPADAGVQGPCAAGELLGPDDHCHFIETVLLSWDAARARCQMRGAGWDLGVVRTAEESTFLAAAIGAEVWLGAADTASEGSWSWVTDTTPFWTGGAMGAAVGGAYTNWNVTEPNGGVTTNCVRALPDTFGSPVSGAPWADLPCTQLRGSLCEDHGVVE